jgi:PEP-CTERM motif
MKTLVIALLALMLMWTVPSTAQATTLFTDNFNTENGGVGVLNYSGFSQWSVSGGAVDLIGNGFFDFYPGNGLYVDLDGTMLQAGLSTSTPIPLITGTYTLQFALGGSQRGDTNTVQVTFGAFYSESFVLASSDPLNLITRTFSVTGPGSASLTFKNNGGDNVGAILDNVRLDSVETLPPAVPEPASMTLITLGLACIGMVRRKAIGR